MARFTRRWMADRGVEVEPHQPADGASESSAATPAAAEPLVPWDVPPPRRSSGSRRRYLWIGLGVVIVSIVLQAGWKAAQVPSRANLGSAIAGDTWARLPERQRASFEGRLMTVLGDAPLDAETGARLRANVARGLPMLDDTTLVRRLHLVHTALRRADVEVCAAYARAAFAGGIIDSLTAVSLIDALDDESLVEWYRIVVAALEAERFGYRAPRSVPPAEADAMLDRLLAALDPPTLARVELGLEPSATAMQACLAIRDWYGGIRTLSRSDQAIAALLDVEGTP